jgi:2'-5' RNA ligase
MPSSAEPTRRLFIGLLPDAKVQAAIDAHRRAWFWPPGSRLTRLERIHLTLHFLGEVDAARQAELQQALAELPPGALELLLRRPETWPNHVAVLRADGHEELRVLHERLALQIVRAGLAPERRRWIPHLTLGRNAAGAVPPANEPPIRWITKGFALVWSRLAPAASYEIVGEYGVDC